MFSFGVVCAVVDHTADLAAFTEAAIVCAFDHDCDHHIVFVRFAPRVLVAET